MAAITDHTNREKAGPTSLVMDDDAEWMHAEHPDARDDTVMGVAASLLPRGTQTDDDEAEQLQAVEQAVQGLMDPGLAAEDNMGSSVLQHLILRELASSQVVRPVCIAAVCMRTGT